MDALCTKMMAKNPADRYSSISEVADQIAAIVRTPAVPEPVSQPPSRKSRKWAVAAATALIAVLVAVVIHLRAGTAVLTIEVSDPDIQVAVRGATVILTGPGTNDVEVKPGDNELTITHNGLTFKSDKFTLQRGKNVIVKVSLAGQEIAAQLGDKDLIVTPLSNNSKSNSAEPSLVDKEVAARSAGSSPPRAWPTLRRPQLSIRTFSLSPLAQ